MVSLIDAQGEGVLANGRLGLHKQPNTTLHAATVFIYIGRHFYGVQCIGTSVSVLIFIVVAE